MSLSDYVIACLYFIQVMNYSLEQTEELNPRKLITAVGSASMVTSVQLPPTSATSATSTAPPSNVLDEHIGTVTSFAGAVSSFGVSANATNVSGSAGALASNNNNNNSNSLSATGAQMKSSYAQQLFNGGILNAVGQSAPTASVVGKSLADVRMSSAIVDNQGHGSTAATATAAAAKLQPHVVSSFERPPPPSAASIISHNHETDAGSEQVWVGSQQSNMNHDISVRRDSYRDQMNDNVDRDPPMQTKFFPRTTIEETRDAHQEFESTIYRPTIFPAAKPPPGLYTLHGDEEQSNFHKQNQPSEDYNHPHHHPHPHNLGSVASGRQIYAPNYPIDAANANGAASRQPTSSNRSTNGGTGSGIYATEIDSTSIPHNASYGLMNHGPHRIVGNKPRTIPTNVKAGKSSGIGTWPKELALAAPSTTELHARIAVIASNRAVKSKVANSALIRVNEARRRAQLEAAFAHRNSSALRASFQTGANGVERLSFTSLSDRQKAQSETPTSSHNHTTRGHQSGPGRVEFNGSNSHGDTYNVSPRIPTPSSARRTHQLDSSNRLLREMGDFMNQQASDPRGSTELKQHAQNLLRNRLKKGESRSLLDDNDHDYNVRSSNSGLGSDAKRIRSLSAPARQYSKSSSNPNNISINNNEV